MKKSSIMFLLIAGFAGFTDVHAKSKKDEKPVVKNTREQQIISFSADIPADQPERKGEKMIVTVTPFHADEEGSTIIAQGAAVKRTIYASVEGQARKGVQFKIPRYFVPMDQKDKRFETDQFELVVEMPYHGTEKISPVPVARYRVYMNWDDKTGQETVRLTTNNILLFNAPVDVIDIEPYETSGFEEENM